jgi:hypothetical protein
MDKNATKKSNLKLLLNAEPFGFGPTAAIATIFPYLREKFEYIGYLGKNHTLDLQKNLPYEAIHDVSHLSEAEIKRIAGMYDIFLTALDFETAALAKSAGLRVIIYDPLTWYWKSIPEIVRESDAYFAQNFFGVTEKIEKDRSAFPGVVEIVPPIVSQKRRRSSGEYTLINLGGLQNPMWSVDDVFQYAETFIDALKECIPANEKVVIATSSAVALKLDDSGIRSYTRAEMYDLLEKTKYAFMTPGLGNMYDAAKFDIPTVWLPPANDSQGQQLDLLTKHAMSDGHVDWADLGKPIGYFGEQTIVLECIKEAIYAAADNRAAIKTAVGKAREGVCKKKSSSTSALLAAFGTGGAERIARLVFEYSQSRI